MAGNVGRYISITNGPKALKRPKNNKMNVFEFRLLLIVSDYFVFPVQKYFNRNCFRLS